MTRRIAIIGGGNGGQAFAAYFTQHGHSVKLYDAFESTVNAINERGHIELIGGLELDVPFANAYTDMGEVVADAEIIVIINPSTIPTTKPNILEGIPRIMVYLSIFSIIPVILIKIPSTTSSKRTTSINDII